MDKEQRIQELCEQIRSGSNAKALEAVHELREKGWLCDGSLVFANLRGVDLHDTDLQGANLHRADLTEINLARANLSKADLSESFLNEATLYRSVLSEANLSKADLGGATLTGGNLIGANLHGARLWGADLSGASLNRADLIRAGLNEANLHGAILNEAIMRGAELRNADLSRADLRNADLRNADLFGANLHEVDLIGADLREAKLNGAVLRRTTLSGTDFTESIFGGTVLADVDLSQTKGLEMVRHWSPSDISTKTIFQSQGKIPESFLRGCGVPEVLIQYLPSMVGDAIQFYSCFISYSHAQKDFARRLHDRLQGAGIRCWLDEHQMAPGQDIYEEVNRGIRLWDKVLLCCSKESLSSWWVNNEIGTAFNKEQQLMKERGSKVRAIIPLDLDGYMFSGEWQSGYEVQLKERLVADFTEWKDEDQFEAAFQQVLKALRTDEGREIPPPSKL